MRESEVMPRVQPVQNETLLTPKELMCLGQRLQRAHDPAEIARLRERLARGFYGI